MTVNRLKDLRLRAGLTQQGLADLADTSFQQISRLERGDRKLPPEWLDRLAPHLGVRASAIIDGDAERFPDAKSQAQIVDDPDELALLWLWRGITPNMRRAALTLLSANANGLKSNKIA